MIVLISARDFLMSSEIVPKAFSWGHGIPVLALNFTFMLACYIWLASNYLRVSFCSSVTFTIKLAVSEIW